MRGNGTRFDNWAVVVPETRYGELTEHNTSYCLLGGCLCRSQGMHSHLHPSELPCGACAQQQETLCSPLVFKFSKLAGINEESNGKYTTQL